MDLNNRRLVLEDGEGQVLRAFAWNGQPLQVVRRGDTRRLELISDLKLFEKNKIPYEFLGDLNPAHVSDGTFEVSGIGHLKLLPTVENVATDDHQAFESVREWYFTVGGMLLLTVSMVTLFILNPPQIIPNEQELKQEVIRIVKNIPARQKVVTHADHINAQAQPTEQPKSNVQPKTMDRLKRMGALAALGSLSKSKQNGGLNLGAAKTSAGPGLGGTEGSGGMQTSLYAKGLTSAPLGVGGRVEGAGGYGTKGKGGGQAGYGKLTMVGSTGAAPIGLAQEASIESGLDRDQIAAVVNRNIGQVRFCYEQGLQSDPNLTGRVSVGFVIGANGSVKTASVANTTLNSKMVEDCIVLRLKSWKFPLPQGGVDVLVNSYPFVLKRTGQG